MTSQAASEVNWPPTNEVDAQRKQAFLDSIDRDAVCRLASGQHGGQPCRMFREEESGGFNVCFFVEFATEPVDRWVVRVAIAPALYDAWSKLQSEVATMRYVEAKTDIPLPHVHAYGRAALGPEACYVIMDYIDAQPLDLDGLLEDASPAEQRRLYRQLVDVLAQLRQLEFDACGSLMPGKTDSDPVVGPLQSSGHSELQRLTGGVYGPLSVYRSASAFAWAHMRVLEAAYADVPMDDTTLAHARMETFALQDVRARLEEVLGEETPFVLAHTDLRWSNILVDAGLSIRGIIDWEWSAVVPRRFFTPPAWLAGASSCYVASLAYEQAYSVFYSVLKDVSTAGARALAAEWGPDVGRRIDFPLAILLQHHYNLVPAYYFSVFPKCYPVTPDCMPPQTVARLFAHDAALHDGAGGPLTCTVRRRMTAVAAYRHYLSEHGLLVEYELKAETRAWLRKRDRLYVQMLAQMLAKSAEEGRAPPAEAARVLRESVLQASIQPRNLEPVLGELGINEATTSDACQ